MDSYGAKKNNSEMNICVFRLFLFVFVIDLRNRNIYEPDINNCESGDENVTMKRNQ